jgi:CBS domain-containing protein
VSTTDFALPLRWHKPPSDATFEVMEIGPLASKSVLSLGPNVTVRETAKRMIERGVGSAVVMTEDGRPGIITERDLMRAVADGADTHTTVVEQYMTPDAITASPPWDITDAGARMLAGGFRHLLVLGEDGTVTGVLSIRDLARALLELVRERSSGGG